VTPQVGNVWGTGLFKNRLLFHRRNNPGGWFLLPQSWGTFQVIGGGGTNLPKTRIILEPKNKAQMFKRHNGKKKKKKTA